MIDESNLNDRQKQQVLDQNAVVEIYGQYDQTTGANGSHYAPADKNPFKAEGLVCSNCVFFEGGQACEIVAGQIDPNAVCKLWVIPENLLGTQASQKGHEGMKINFSVSSLIASENNRELKGRIVTWNETGNTSVGATMFAPESLKFNKTAKLLLEHDHTRPIGRLASYEVNAEGVDATFKVAPTMAGDDALLEASGDWALRDGFSVGVFVDKFSQKDGVTVIESARVQEVSLVTEPAIRSARVAASENDEVTDVQISEATVSDVTPTEGEQVSDTTVQAPAVDEAVEAAQVEAAAQAPKPVAYATPRSPIVSSASYLEHSVKAAMGDKDSAQYVAFADDTSNNTGLTLPTHMNEFITNQIGGRPAVDAISRAALPATGMSFTIPKLTQAPTITTVAENGDTTAGDEMTSSYITVDVKKAAKSEIISWELLDRSSPSYYAELVAALNKSYAKLTDSAVISAFIAGGTAGTGTTGDIDGLQAFIAEAAPAAYSATGSFAKNLVTNASWWSELIGAQDSTGRPIFNAQGATANANGSVGTDTLVGNVLGLNYYVDPHVGSGLVDDSAWVVAPDAITFYEAPKTQLSVQVLGNGQLSVGVYGYYAIATKLGGGIRRFNKA
jgi:HK97 family phage major capsid protein/HK97 family phage prohead protease